ncbi:hypothetical protein TUM17387_04490 [Shewanella carassii]|uniref:hypothetical protein n=1 Tax=Shewanella carassii TaxID=1987584 RepID=UPI001BED6A84|nr:hypothetical protein [Shewanella carassii]BCV65090.1 hypothetical protein TUM17387_04490 [Shewanella carassii]
MSKAISKELWQDIETEMTAMFVNITFTYKGHELSVRRERSGESKTVLTVYIDGFIKGVWIGIKQDLTNDAPSIIPEVWCQRSKAIYTAKQIAQIEKIWGKREAKKQHPRMHEKLVWHEPFFPKASVLCRQFKKLDGLELTKAACMQCSTPTG